MSIFKRTAVILAILGLTACGGGGGGGSAPTPNPAGDQSGTTGDSGANDTSSNADCGTCSTSIKLDGTVSVVTKTDVSKDAGSTITVSDSESVQLTGTTVVIPANSLTDNTTVTISEVKDSTLVPSDVLVTDIGPSGTQLDPTLPADISIKYDPTYLTNNGITDLSTLKVVAYDDNAAPQTLKQTTLTDTTNNLVSAETTHFSYFAVMGYTNASLKGYYSVINYNYLRDSKPLTAPAVGLPLPAPQGFENISLTAYFDGAGNWSFKKASINDDGVISTLAAADLCGGTYTVSVDGTLTVTPDPASDCTGGSGQVLVGGSTFVMSIQLPGQDPAWTVGIQRTDSTYSNASLSGAYTGVGVYFDSAALQASAPSVGLELPAMQGFSSDLDFISFDGKGGYNDSTIENRNGVVTGPDPSSGTYSVAADGSVVFDGGSKAQLLAGGSILVLANNEAADAGADPENYVLIQQQAGKYSNATLKGTYTVVLYGYDYTQPQGTMPNPGVQLPPPNGFQSVVALITFDSSTGTFSVDPLKSSVNVDGNIVPVTTTSGTYSVDASGAVTLVTGLDTYEGQVLRDGSTFVMASTSSGTMSQVAVGLAR